MFNSIFKYISGDETPEQRYNTYIEWQSKQKPTHFHNSEIYNNFISNTPDFDIDAYHSRNSNTISTIYCFGLFNNFVLTGNNRASILPLFGHLLSLYDLNKGTMRYFRGDPPAIEILRKCFHEKTIQYFFEFDFEPFLYPYQKIHAHTLCQYSLHTLIMRLICHALTFVEPNKNFHSIETFLCDKAWVNGIYGNPTLKSSQPLLIVKKPETPNQTIPNILPDMTFKAKGSPPSRELKCSKCKCNVTELWSIYHLCYNCFINKYCVHCGDESFVKGDDGYPRCYVHRTVPITIDPRISFNS